jgi:hypothetical protein
LERICEIVSRIGEYPHASLSPADRPFKRDSTRLIKVVCPQCGYTCRTTRKWLAVGFPRCPHGDQMRGGHGQV